MADDLPEIPEVAASVGGLFILAGDTDAAGVGGKATADVVTIGTVTISLNLSDQNTFGAMGGSRGRRLRHRFRDQPNTREYMRVSRTIASMLAVSDDNRCWEHR